MKVLQTGWKKLTASVLAMLMALGMVACNEQPSAPNSEIVNVEQEDDKPQDQQQTDDQTTDTDTKTDADEGAQQEDSWELPEQEFQDQDETPSNEEEDVQKPTDEETPSDDQEDYNEGSYDGGAIVLPEDIWE